MFLGFVCYVNWGGREGFTLIGTNGMVNWDKFFLGGSWDEILFWGSWDECFSL